MVITKKIIVISNTGLLYKAVLAVYLSLVFTTYVFAQSTDRNPIEINLPAQSMEQSITQLATQTGALIGVDASLIANKQAPELNGRYTPAEALVNLLSGTGLVVVENAPNNYTLESSPELMQLASNDDATQLPEVKVTGFMDADAPGNPSYTRINSTSANKTNIPIETFARQAA